ncbi:DNA polymerase/3'-5' exonuclease PolX [Desulfovermiculus halophilus]|jgi:DNA polymerase (family 10)|uniref:DNA polymerase/3'-5' exonuclease PolX n=1 Tax=Desulfovermiculus halophilus TaxID=339722 RepID=UPI000481067F|nr:DNA polymerase/3'-5' exonuclease PolX [Desulfovermiculus halophilus]
MPAHNKDVASMFEELADILEIEGANPFRVRAYRNGARAVSGLAHNLRELVSREEDLTEYPGIGRELAGKIKEIVQTGSLSALEKARQRVSPELVSLLHVQGLGPKRIKALHDELGVNSAADLQQAAAEGKVAQLSGFGPKIQKNILAEVKRFQSQEKRFKLAVVEDVAQDLVRQLQKQEGVQEVTVAGSFRRRKETVGDLDILVTGSGSDEVMQALIEYEDVRQVLAHGRTKSSVVLKNGLQVDLRFVEPESFGAALHYFTGSKAHNIAVRRLALDLELKVNEYGVFRGETQIAGASENEVYSCVGLPYIQPELREDRGELEAGAKGLLPTLIEETDLRGDLHVHTTASDGMNTLEDLAQAARELGYEYLGISDHTRNLGMAGGLDEQRLVEQIEEIEAVNDRLSGMTLLKGSEVDILKDGSLDLPDWILQKLDLCICSVHTAFNLSAEKQTERILRAMDNPNCTILGHPSGRLIGAREAYALDMERILRGARERGCILELNSQPDRLDLDDISCKAAKELGVKVAISSDAHQIGNLGLVRFGVGQARRGWLEAGDVVNTRSLAELREILQRW